MPPTATFTGFPRSAPGFFHELAAEMNRDWFQDNKVRYERDWVEPMQQLLDGVAAKLAPTYKPRVLGQPKVMRIHRDVRFSKDKSPYKTHIGASIHLGNGKLGECSPAALYLHFGVDEEMVGSGIYMFDPKQLARWRKAVAGKPGESLTKIIGKLRKAGYNVGGHDDYKKVPKGFDPDHPRAELLKMKGLTAGPDKLPKGILHKAELAGWITDHGKAMAPMVHWLHDTLA